MKRDLVTLQVGTTANFVGAHFWNLQDEYLAIPPQKRELSPTTFFRSVSPGSRAARSGLTYAPRLQIIDATGAFGALSTNEGTALPESKDVPKVSGSWSNKVDKFIQQPIPKSKYVRSLMAEENCDGAHQLSDVRYWSDYLKTRFHPRTSFPLQGVHHGVRKLDDFEVGTEIAKSSLLEDAYDDLRFFIEDCDNFGGLCVLTDADNAYAGFTKSYLEHIGEEVGQSSPVLLFSVHDIYRGYSKKANSAGALRHDILRAQNEAKLVAASFELSSEYIPISTRPINRFSHVHARPDNLFENSGVIGTGIHVALSPLQTDLSLVGLLSAIRPAPFATFGSLSCNFPEAGKKLEYKRAFNEIEGSVSLSSMCFDYPILKENKNKGSHAGSLSTLTEIASARGIQQAIPIHSNISAPVTLPLPFPIIFDSRMERNRGVEMNISNSDGGTAMEVDQIAAIAGLSMVREEAHRCLSSLSRAVAPSTRKMVAQFAGIEDEELREMAETLEARGADCLTI